jgi:hypothetical protein
MKAIIAMNLFAIGATGQSLVFKSVAVEGINVLDYLIIRNISILVLASLQLSYLQINPFKQFPYTHKHSLLWRIITG